MKQGHLRKNWLRRYFVVQSDHLLYFTEKGGEFKGSFALAHSEIRIDDEGAKRAHSFTIFSVGLEVLKSLTVCPFTRSIGNHTYSPLMFIQEKASLKLQAASQIERAEWSCALDPQFRLSEIRKKYEKGLSTVADGSWFKNLRPEEEEIGDMLEGIEEEDREELDLSILNGGTDPAARLHIQLNADRSRFLVGISKSVHRCKPLHKYVACFVISTA